MLNAVEITIVAVDATEDEEESTLDTAAVTKSGHVEVRSWEPLVCANAVALAAGHYPEISRTAS